MHVRCGSCSRAFCRYVHDAKRNVTSATKSLGPFMTEKIHVLKFDSLTYEQIERVCSELGCTVGELLGAMTRSTLTHGHVWSDSKGRPSFTVSGFTVSWSSVRRDKDGR